jgi:hypothetical protein
MAAHEEESESIVVDAGRVDWRRAVAIGDGHLDRGRSGDVLVECRIPLAACRLAPQRIEQHAT